VRGLLLIHTFITMRRALLTAGCVIVAAALLVPGMLIWSVLYTSAGAQFVVRHLPQQLGPVRLRISGLSGTVAAGLHVERVEVDHDLVHLEFENISGRVALAPLMLQTIHVLHGSVGSALVVVKRRTRPPTAEPPVFLPRWLSIDVDDAAVGRALLTVPNGFRLSGSEIHGAAVIRHSYIRFFQAEGLLPQLRVSASGDLRAADPLALAVNARIDWMPPGQPGWKLEGAAHGDLKALDVIGHVIDPFRADFNGRGLDLTERWHWVADAVVQDFNLSAWGLPGPLGSISGRLSGGGDAHGFSAHGPLDPAGLHAGVFETQFSGNYADHVLTATQMEVRHPASGARASGAGTIAIVDHGPRLALAGSWSEFRWPLIAREPAVRSATGTYAISGILPYQVRLTGTGSSAGLAPMPIDVSGSLGRDSFIFDNAQVALFGGQASLAGRIVWSPSESWSVSGRAMAIDPGAVRPDLPGSVSFNFGASGSGFSEHGNLTAAFSNLSGKLRGVAARGSGTVTRAGAAWGFSNVRLGLGTTSLALDGHVDDRLDLRFEVTTSDLSVLTAGTRGELKASGRISGPLSDPTIDAHAHGGDFEYQEVKLEALDADVNFNPQATQAESKVDVRLRKLSFRGRTLDTVVFTLNGPPAAYNAQLALTAPGLAAGARAVGAYVHGVFKGQLNALAVSGSEQLRLALERPVELTVAADHLRLEWLCLLGTPGSMCADGEWTPAEWSTTVMSEKLPLNTLTAGMTPAVEYVGTLSALLRLSGAAGQAVQGTLQARLENAEVDHRLASHRIEHTRIGSGTITATATASLMTAQLALGDTEAGSIQGRLEVHRSGERGVGVGSWAEMPIVGELHAKTAELGLVSLYAPDIDRASGLLVADLQLAGTLHAPRISGSLKVDNGEIDVYQVNLGLRRISLDARLGDAGLDFRGAAHAGTGEVAATGHIEWRNLLPYGTFHLQGSNLRVADVPEAQIDASPDLDFTVSGRRIEVSGKVEVPYAKIQPKDITNAVRASPDEVIVGSELEDPNKRFEVVSNITLALGDKVSLDAMGLAARLTGSVTVRSGYDAITRGTGELAVASGTYTAYARKLDIQRGRLIFSGGPVDDPGIDVVAQKQFPDVTAGVKVRGTLIQPRMSFFSDPPLPQSQVVSLILAGGSLQSAQNASNAALGQGAALLAAELGPRVGLPDVSVETDPIANETSLVLGHYLSPRLYVSYGVSLTEQLNVFKMRYTLGDHWTVRTELGTARGADLVYSIDR
jgi:translocation and assembly module TamB